MKDEFFAMVAHELRAPLTSMLSWSRRLRIGKLNKDQSQHAIEAIERNVKAQAQLITDLLDVSCILTGKMALTLSLIDCTKVLEQAIDAVRPAADAKSIELIIKLVKCDKTIAADPIRLPQIFWNLLSNAIKFTPVGGCVDVQLCQVEQDYEITITDNGEGIGAEYLPYIFDRFSQA